MYVYLHVFSRFNVGGAERQLSHLIDNSNQVHYVVALSRKNSAVNFLSNKDRLIGIFDALKLFKSRKVIVVSWFYSGLLIGLPLKLLAVKLIGTLRQESQRAHRLYYFSKLVAKYYDTIIYNSRVAMISHNKDGWPVARSLVVHNGYPDVQLRESAINLSGRIVQYGRYTKTKGFELFADVAKSNQNLKFACIGPCVEESFWAPDNCLLLGERSLSFVMDSASVIVQLSQTESFSNVWAEAIICGKPLVITAVGDFKAIENISGVFIVGPNVMDVTQGIYAAKNWYLDQSLQDLEMRRKQFLEYFSIKGFVERFESFSECVE